LSAKAVTDVRGLESRIVVITRNKSRFDLVFTKNIETVRINKDDLV
jgi:hypothetical protein